MVNFNNVSKHYGKRVLFDNISLSINRSEKIGLIGPNGAGKTTLFGMIQGQIESSSGTIQVNKNVHIGYLPQESNFKSEHTVIAELTEREERIMRLVAIKDELEAKNETAGSQYGEVLHNLEALGYFELEHKAKKILMGLGFKEKDFYRPISSLSGGWQMRALLGKLLTFQYDLLLLDEPTNYLDLNAALWLKDYLAVFPGTFIIISHDRAFLTDVTNYTLILENGIITKVKGNYEHYERIKEERRVHLTRQFKEQEKKVKQLEKFVARFHAQPNKAASVRAKRRVLERIDEEKIELPKERRESIREFQFPQSPRRSGWRVMALEKISKSYDDIQVYKDLDFEAASGEKAVLAGDNGAGKSTLLKILAGVIDINSGNRITGHNVDIGYFSQTRMDVLNQENTVLQEAYSAAPGYMSEESIRTILGAFLFTGEDSDKKVKVLSGGEKSRLILAKLLINPPNFLLLDEPTTHLDVDAVAALIRALNQFEGTIVFISHDIYFVRSVANIVFEVKDGSVRKIHGNFDYYLEKKKKGGLSEDGAQKKKEFVAAKQKADSREHLLKEEEKNRKKHNTQLWEKINGLLKEKEGLRLESYAKARALSNQNIYREEETVKEYGRRIKDIERRLNEIDSLVFALKKEIV